MNSYSYSLIPANYMANTENMKEVLGSWSCPMIKEKVRMSSGKVGSALNRSGYLLKNEILSEPSDYYIRTQLFILVSYK